MISKKLWLKTLNPSVSQFWKSCFLLLFFFLNLYQMKTLVKWNFLSYMWKHKLLFKKKTTIFLKKTHKEDAFLYQCSTTSKLWCVFVLGIFGWLRGLQYFFRLQFFKSSTFWIQLFRRRFWDKTLSQELKWRYQNKTFQ